MSQRFAPGFGLDFGDFYARDGLVGLDARFVEFLQGAQPGRAWPADGGARGAGDLAGKPESELIIALAPELEDFIAELFGIAGEMAELKRRHDDAGAALHGEAIVRAAPGGEEIFARAGRRRSTRMARSAASLKHCSAAN